MKTTVDATIRFLKMSAYPTDALERIICEHQEMLEALRGLVSVCEIQGITLEGEYDMKAARAAIAKAEGRT